MATPPDIDLTALMKIAERAKKQGGWFRRADLTRPSALAFSVVDANYIEAWTPGKATGILTRLIDAEAALTKAEARVAVLEGALINADVALTALINRYGYEEDNLTPKDWSEWVFARKAQNGAAEALASASGEGS